MHARRLLSATLAATAILAAGCADATTTAPDASAPDAKSGAQAGRDTTIGGITYVANVRIRGRVLATTWREGRTVGDTLTGFVPVAGAHVTIYRNVLVDGEGVSVKVGEATTGADGAYEVARVPGGPYVISLNVTPGNFYGETHVYALGTKPEITADIRVWRNDD